MNRRDFESEVLKSNMCPENFKEMYRSFRHFQDEAIRTLNEFHRVCEKNGVRYQLAYGSLLGAVRDNGQIPWDYDIDVIVPFNEKERLVNALEKDLSHDYYYYCPEKDKKCRHFIMRLAPKGYKTTLLHVDVFYAIGAPEDEWERDCFEKEMQKLFWLRVDKLIQFNELTTIKRKIKVGCKKLLLFPVTVKNITNKMGRICRKYNLDDSDNCIILQGEYRNKTFKTKKLWDTELIKTEIGLFRITKNYDEVLHIIYGDYHKIFPLENRLNEMITHYKILSGKDVTWNRKVANGRYYMKKQDMK